ncbi:hypothetical protein HaLaN_12416, partial [Haematococcus lacustris]
RALRQFTPISGLPSIPPGFPPIPPSSIDTEKVRQAAAGAANQASSAVYKAVAA